MYWKIIQEDHEFIVTRASTAIALHHFTQQHRSQSGFQPPTRPIALSTGGPAMPQAFSTRTKQNKNEVTKEKPKNFHHSIAKQKKRLLWGDNSVASAVR
jgi:hypothetical protein